MKQLFLFGVMLLCAGSGLWAQNAEFIQEKEKLYTLDFEYFPELQELKITYSCNSGIFDEKEAITTIKNRLIPFTKEKGYFSYSFYTKDVLKYDNENRIAKYTSFVKFYY
jgi:hypothetical protein